MEQKSPKLKIIVSLWLAVCVLSGCALSFQPKNLGESYETVPIPSTIVEPKLVKVLFFAQPAQSFSEEDQISLDILDLVTGENYNLERVAMTETETGFGVSVMLPLGATVAYRYSLIHPIEVGELRPDGKTLKFREAVVKENLVITDIIAGWTEASYTGPLVDLNGVVADDSTEAPLGDVLVNVAGLTALTDMNGRFFIRGLPVGKHNLVATLADGSYLSFQQEVNMVENLATLAIVRMTPAVEVTISFKMTPPNEAVGAPVRIAGNMGQFGQTYADMQGGNGALAVNMPLMTRDADGNYIAHLKLFAGSYLRYQYTLGDALVNSERGADGSRHFRHFVVPGHDAIVDEKVTTWRTQQQKPVSMLVTSPSPAEIGDSVYVQFNTGTWSNPIPMWSMENNEWLLVYYPRQVDGETVSYRYCRNADCTLGEETLSVSAPRSFVFGATTEISDQISGFRMWEPLVQSQSAIEPVNFDPEALVGVELDPHYSSNQTHNYPVLINQLTNGGFNWLILTPSWQVGLYKDLPVIDSSPAATIPSRQLAQLAVTAQQQGMKVAIYPQLIFPTQAEVWWKDSMKSMIWWQQWYADYERMVMHTIKLATAIKADQIILGGPQVANSYPGAMETIGENFGTPKTSEDIWNSLLTKTDEYYEGQLLLAQAVGSGEPESHSFFEKAQGFYLLIDADLQRSTTYNDDVVGNYLDTTILPFRDAQNKPVYLGINGASFQSVQINPVLDEAEILSANNPAFSSQNVDLECQALFYSAYAAAIAERGWISGVASRGFYPALPITDFSSSIYGKPAFTLFNNQ